MSALEVAAVAASLLGIWLTARRAMLCWPMNLVACLLYFRLFLSVRLYADTALQALFALAVLFGWVEWARGRNRVGALVVEPLPPRMAAVGLAAGAVGAVAIGWLAARFTNAALPWADATLSSFSLVGQVWTARRHAASWWLWIAVDAAYVGLFAVKGLWLTAGLYAVFIALAVAGLRQWRRASAVA